MRENGFKKTIFQIATLAALMYVTYYLIMRDKDIYSVVDVVIHSSKIWLIAAMAVMLLYVFCGGWAIRVLMKARGKKVTIWQCFKYSFIEFYFSALTPSSTGGQPAQLFYMKKDGFPAPDGTVVLIAITALYKLSLVILTLILVLFNIRFMSGPILSIWPLVLLGLVLNLGLVAVLILLLYSRKVIKFILSKIISFLGRIHLVADVERKKERIEETVSNYHECATLFATNKLLVVKTFGVLTLQRIALLTVPYLVYKSFGLSGVTALQILSTQALLYLCVEMMPLPGAVGISETVFLILFTPIFLEKNITTAVLLSRGISFYILVILSGIVVIGVQIANIIKRKKRYQ